MHHSKQGQLRKIRDLRRLAANADDQTPADAWFAVELSKPLLYCDHGRCPLTVDEVGLMLRGFDGRHVVWVTRQPSCLLSVLVGSGVEPVGYVDSACWEVDVPRDISTIT